MMPKIVPSGSRKRSARGEALEHLGTRDHLVHGPAGGPAHVHVLDEAHLGAHARAELDEIGELVVIGAADHHAVELEPAPAHAVDGLDALEDLGVAVPPRQRPEAVGPEGDRKSTRLNSSHMSISY